MKHAATVIPRWLLTCWNIKLSSDHTPILMKEWNPPPRVRFTTGGTGRGIPPLTLSVFSPHVFRPGNATQPWYQSSHHPQGCTAEEGKRYDCTTMHVTAEMNSTKTATAAVLHAPKLSITSCNMSVSYSNLQRQLKVKTNSHSGSDVITANKCPPFIGT